ncbi:hypothetical protein C0989_011994, partial [Termitomyces sp. Mn162]
ESARRDSTTAPRERQGQEKRGKTREAPPTTRAHAASCWVLPPRVGKLDASPEPPPKTPPSPLAPRDETWSASEPPENPPLLLRTTLPEPRQPSRKENSTTLTTPVP